jgi:diacylglycerol O-acyltransferase / wax synthase
MERLSGLDAAFLHMETPDMHLHVVGVILMDPSTVPGGYSFDKVKQLLKDRLHLLDPFRRRLAEVPFNLGRPVWVDYPDFDLDAHVHRIGVPSPGTMRELAVLVGDIAGTPLDRRRPLWQMWVAEGLEDGLIAAITKMHHAAIDGVTGADLMAHLFDLSPVVEEKSVPEDWKPERTPTEVELLADALGRRFLQPVRMARTVVRTGQAMMNVVNNRRAPNAQPAAYPFTAPMTPFNGAITPHRAATFSRASLDDMKLIKRAFGVTVNDVVLGACTISLRNWLIAHDALPEHPLVASCPVSVHGHEGIEGTNRVSSMFVALPVQLEDPVEQLAAIHEVTKGAKEIHNALGADMLSGLAEFLPPRLVNQATKFYSRHNLADRHRPVHNLIISNVPGPPVPLYCGGARVVATYPLGPIMEGSGLNITVLSNMGNVDFGALACREMVPDLWDIADGFAEAVTTLRKLAEERTAEPAHAPTPAPPVADTATGPGATASEKPAKKPRTRTPKAAKAPGVASPTGPLASAARPDATEPTPPDPTAG